MKKQTHKIQQKDLKEDQPIKSYYLLISLIPIYLFFSMVDRYAVNIPILDDWDAILGFTVDWYDAGNNEKFSLLLSQHNEHRIFTSRLVYALYYSLTQKIDFITLGLIANLQLLVIFGFLVYFSTRLIKLTWPVISIFTALCVFDPSNYENSMMAMAGMANYGVIMLFLISLFFYSLNSKRFVILATFFQIICAFSNGNGLIAGVVLVFYCLAEKDRIKLSSSIIAFLLSVVFYFQDYHSTQNNLTGKGIFPILEFFLRLMGGHFGRDYRIFIAILVSISVLFFIYLLIPKIKKAEKESLPFLALTLFIILSTGSVAVFRSAEESKIEAFSYSSRYLIYPHLFAAIAFILLAYILEKTKIKWIAISIVGFIYIKAYATNYSFGEAMFNVYRNRAIMNKYHYPIQEKASKIETKACEKKIYCLEENRPPVE